MGLKILNERGFEKYTGGKIRKVYKTGVTEYFTDHPFNGEYKKGDLNINCSLSQVKCSPFGKVLYGVLCGGAKVVALTAENPAMITESIKTMPLRSFSGFTGGIVPQKSVDGILDLCNGTKGGLKKIITGFKKEK